MRYPGLSRTERVVSKAFYEGERVALNNRADRLVRASVLRSLLFSDAPSKQGKQSALRITGAKIVGRLEMVQADISAPVSLHDCTFDETIDIYGSRFRQLSLPECTLYGIDAANSIFESNVRLSRCQSVALAENSSVQVTRRAHIRGGCRPGGHIFGR
jgi:hypothetical protein